MIFTYRARGEDVSVTVERQADGRFRATIGNRTLTFDAWPVPNGWLIDLGNERTRVYVAAQEGERHVSAAGHTYTLVQPTPRASRRRAATGGDLTAQMPGQVLDVLVREGDAVERGQPLVILEAMKMELRVNAPADGRVKRLLVKPGEVVERGQLLVEIEEAPRERGST